MPLCRRCVLTVIVEELTTRLQRPDLRRRQLARDCLPLATRLVTGELHRQLCDPAELGARTAAMHRLRACFCRGTRVWRCGPDCEAMVAALLQDLLEIAGCADTSRQRGPITARLRRWFRRRPADDPQGPLQKTLLKVLDQHPDPEPSELIETCCLAGRRLVWRNLVDDPAGFEAACRQAQEHALAFREGGGRLVDEGGAFEDGFCDLLRRWLLDAGCCPPDGIAGLVVPED